MIKICGHLADAESALARQIAELAGRPYGELMLLTPWCDLGRAASGIEISRYMTPLADGRLQVVVQAYRRRRRYLLIEIGQMAALGFWITPSGEVTVMPQKALHEYT